MSNQTRPGTQFEQNIDKVGQNLIKRIVNTVTQQIKNIFKNESAKSN